MTVDAFAGRLAHRGWFLSESFKTVWPIWLASRVFTIGAAVVSAAIADESLSHALQRWDAGWFLRIAEHGYRGEPGAPAFYPLYPFLLRAGGDILGGHPVLAGFVLGLVLTLLVFVLLHALARCRVGEREARLAVAYLAVFPTAFFLQALYSEALFLVLALAAFLVAEHSRFALAGVFAGGAMLTRPLGIAVLAGLIFFARRAPARAGAFARLCTAPLIFAAYPIALMAQGRRPLAFLSAESHWRDTSSTGVVHGTYNSLLLAWHGAGDLASGYDYVALLNITALIALVGFAFLSVLAWRRLGASYGVYCLVSLVMPVAAPADPWPLASMQRFVLALFPCFIVVGALRVGRVVHFVLLALSATVLVVLVRYWIRGEFVA